MLAPALRPLLLGALCVVGSFALGVSVGRVEAEIMGEYWAYRGSVRP